MKNVSEKCYAITIEYYFYKRKKVKKIKNNK